ncbi:MAG: hypothetical protein AABX70_06825 [Nanoarchaeota archaeon]
MNVSIDDLCKELGVKEVAPSEWRSSRRERSHIFEESRIPYEVQACLFDGYTLAPTRAISPIVCERLAGAESVGVMGYGTGFRLLLDALNNPDTSFIGIDQDPRCEEVVKRRMERLNVKNIELRVANFFKLNPVQDRFACVVAIDCLPDTVPKEFRGRMNLQGFMRGSYFWFCQMVKPSSPPSFMVAANYGLFTRGHAEMYAELGNQAGLNRFEALGFSYQKREEPEKSGALLFCSREV